MAFVKRWLIKLVSIPIGAIEAEEFQKWKSAQKGFNSSRCD